MSLLNRIFAAAEEANRREILRLMASRPGARLLDLGCGDARFTLRVAQRVGTQDVTGVELIEPLASQAEAAGVRIVRANLNEPLPLPDASFDAIHSNQVIEHLTGTDNFMREIRRLLAPGGFAVLSTNNLSSWHNIVSLIFGWQPPPCHVSDEAIVGTPAGSVHKPIDFGGQTHLRLFTGRALTDLGSLHGLTADVQSASGYYPLPPRPSRLMARTDRRHAAYLVHRFTPA